jgi:hypothetical protein
MGLCRIIGGPILGVRGLLDGFGDGDGLRDGHTAVAVLLALHGKLDGKEMLALYTPCFMVWAGTMGRFWIRADGIPAMARLGGHEPDLALLGQFTRCRNAHTTLFTLVEFELNILRCCSRQVVSLMETPQLRYTINRA